MDNSNRNSRFCAIINHLPPETLGRFQMLDASYYGKPQSVLCLARSNARLENCGILRAENLYFALERFLARATGYRDRCEKLKWMKR